MSNLEQLQKMLGELGTQVSALKDRPAGITADDVRKIVTEVTPEPEKPEATSSTVDKSIVRRAAWQDGNVPMQNKHGRQTDFFFTRAIRGMVTNNWSGAEFEKTVMIEGSDVLGGYIVPEEFSQDLIDLLMATSVVRAAGATVIPMARDILHMPRLTAGATAYWMGEDQTIAPTNVTFGQFTMQAKKLAAMVQLSNELLADSSPAAETVVRNDLARRIALKEDLSFLEGTGNGFEPLGIRNYTTGTGATDVNTVASVGTPAFEDLYDALQLVEADNTRISRWIMHPRTKNSLRKIRAGGSTTGDGAFLYNPSPSVREPDTLIGLPVSLTTQVSITEGASSNESYIIGGDFSEALIGQRAGLTLAASSEAGTAFEKDETWIRAILREDFGLRQPNAFVLLTGITT